jgi:hypothetical protein
MRRPAGGAQPLPRVPAPLRVPRACSTNGGAGLQPSHLPEHARRAHPLPHPWRAQSAAHNAAWEVDVVEKQRLLKMLPDREEFAATIMSRREEEFRALKASRDRVRAPASAFALPAQHVAARLHVRLQWIKPACWPNLWQDVVLPLHRSPGASSAVRPASGRAALSKRHTFRSPASLHPLLYPHALLRSEQQRRARAPAPLASLLRCTAQSQPGPLRLRASPPHHPAPHRPPTLPQAIAEKRAAKKIEREIKRRHKFVEQARQQVQDRLDELEEQARAEEEAKKRADQVGPRGWPGPAPAPACCRLLPAACCSLAGRLAGGAGPLAHCLPSPRPRGLLAPAPERGARGGHRPTGGPAGARR